MYIIKDLITDKYVKINDQNEIVLVGTHEFASTYEELDNCIDAILSVDEMIHESITLDLWPIEL